MTMIIAAIMTSVALIAIIAFALSYVRTIKPICDLIREKKPAGWERGLRQVFWNGWFTSVILGFRRLQISDDNYRRLLWKARTSLAACALIWLAWIALFGWLFRSPA
jgi:Na+/proline symporter